MHCKYNFVFSVLTFNVCRILIKSSQFNDISLACPFPSWLVIFEKLANLCMQLLFYISKTSEAKAGGFLF